MKKSIFAFAAALAALVACNKNEATPMQPQNQESLVPCELTVGISGAMTKATAVTTENEAKVNNLQIFVFRGDDLDATHQWTTPRNSRSHVQPERESFTLS